MSDSQTSEQLIQDRVVQTAERFENEYDSIDDIEPLDVTAEVSMQGHVKNITLVLCTGGPHIEINVSTGTVTGYWGGESHSVPIFKNEELVDHLDEYYGRRFEELVLA